MTTFLNTPTQRKIITWLMDQKLKPCGVCGAALFPHAEYVIGHGLKLWYSCLGNGHDEGFPMDELMKKLKGKPITMRELRQVGFQVVK